MYPLGRCSANTILDPIRAASVAIDELLMKLLLLFMEHNKASRYEIGINLYVTKDTDSLQRRNLKGKADGW
jgi:hypothetical protein